MRFTGKRNNLTHMLHVQLNVNKEHYFIPQICLVKSRKVSFLECCYVTDKNCARAFQTPALSVSLLTRSSRSPSANLQSKMQSTNVITCRVLSSKQSTGFNALPAPYAYCKIRLADHMPQDAARQLSGPCSRRPWSLLHSTGSMFAISHNPWAMHRHSAFTSLPPLFTW